MNVQYEEHLKLSLVRNEYWLGLCLNQQGSCNEEALSTLLENEFLIFSSS